MHVTSRRTKKCAPRLVESVRRPAVKTAGRKGPCWGWGAYSMISERQRQRSRLVPYALSLFVVLVLGLSILVGIRDNAYVLKGGAVFAASGDTFRLTAPLKFPAAPGLTLTGGTISLARSKGKEQGMAAFLSSGEAKLLLDGAVLSFDASEDGRHGKRSDGEESADITAPLLATLMQLSFDSLSLNRSTIAIRNGNRAADLLTNVSAEIICKRKQSLHAKGTFNFNGDQVAFDVTMGATLDHRSGNQYPVRASFKAPLIQATLDGRLSLADGFRLQSPNAEVSGSNLRRAMHWLGTPWPSGPGFGEFRARGELEWTERAIAFQKATFEADGNVATGTLSLLGGGSRLAIEGTLALKGLDLTRYTPGPATKNANGGQSREASPPAGPLNVLLPFVKDFDADLRVSADRVIIDGATLGRSAATLSLKQGKLLADIAELELDGTGHGGGQLSVDTNGPEPRVSVRGKLESVEVGPPLAAIFGHPVVQGRADVAIELTANGGSNERLLGTLGGKMTVALAEGGGRFGLDAGSLAAEAHARELAGWGVHGRGYTKIERLDARLLLAAGILTIESAKAYDGSTAYAAHGTLDLLQRTADLKLSVIRGLSEDRAADNDLSRDVVLVRGGWAAPHIRLVVPPDKAVVPEIRLPEPLVPSPASRP